MADQIPPQAQGQPYQVEAETLPPVVSLGEAVGLETAAQALLGTKAANLVRLAETGFPVPAGDVVGQPGHLGPDDGVVDAELLVLDDLEVQRGRVGARRVVRRGGRPGPD